MKYITMILLALTTVGASAQTVPPAKQTPPAADASKPTSQSDVDALNAKVAQLNAVIKNQGVAIQVLQSERNTAQDQYAQAMANQLAPIPQAAAAPTANGKP